MMKWMFWVGPADHGADVLIALAITAPRLQDGRQDAGDWRHTGVLALAQVVGIHETGTRINDQPLVKIDLQVSGPGITPFVDAGPGDRVGVRGCR